MRLIILGAGGFGRTVYDLAKQANKYSEIYFLDDASVDSCVIGKCSEYQQFVAENTEFYPAIGNNKVRQEWISTLNSNGIQLASIIHKSCYVSPTAKIGKGCVVLPNSVINTNVVINDGCIINCGAIIDHDCIIESSVHVCLGAIIKAENRIKQCSKIEAGEIIQLGTYKL